MRIATIAFLILVFPYLFTPQPSTESAVQANNAVETAAARTYLGFDANDYPGDAALPVLRKTFSFAGYWLNVPPGAKTNSWTGHRAALLKNGFGFLMLFNGRTESQLQPPVVPARLGSTDAELAVQTARREGFPAHTIIFLDQEEGGRMLPVQIDYLYSWIQRVNSSEFSAGIYCSGMKAKEAKGQFIITADDIHERTEAKSFFVYNDACPPSPGCAYLKNPPSPSASGIAYASVWQFAQSPRRREFTKSCSTMYNRDGNCYPPAAAGAATANPAATLLDLDSATSPDPSNARP
ncbi:MAG: glycoside hydrolase domain-containing protein [Candidatus Acidiferrales bacterium]